MPRSNKFPYLHVITVTLKAEVVILLELHHQLPNKQTAILIEAVSHIHILHNFLCRPAALLNDHPHVQQSLLHHDLCTSSLSYDLFSAIQ